MRRNEQGVTFWEVSLSLALMLGWVSVIAPFVIASTERVERLEATVRTYERLQGEVLVDAIEPSGKAEICERDICLPTL